MAHRESVSKASAGQSLTAGLQRSSDASGDDARSPHADLQHSESPTHVAISSHPPPCKLCSTFLPIS